MKTKKNSIFRKVNKRLAVILIIVGGLFFTVQIVVLSRVGTKSQEIEITRSELEEIRRENEKLTAAIDKERSIEEIKSSIEDELLLEKRVIQIIPDSPVAQN